ncbi:hypothetical protein [uncultured Desulfosarcina sp.]|uniref:hypothetical protein n=1 Tax=uncultured Desulfosarcina sp. TaxID=218289 RepID=UPI0029C860F1|nr:hypothetical protein [uncultured Desulfosarcina sp.]
MSNRPSPFFILGAGFGVDAGKIVGPINAESIYIGKYQFNCTYPLVRDLPRICFPDETQVVQVAEVENRLGDAIENGNNDPIERLCNELTKADYYLAPALVGRPMLQNPYSQFFADFQSSSFATYNYDSFVEFALFKAGRWSPHDGYGVEVAVDSGITTATAKVKDSSSLVLHLHGTYLVYSYKFTFGVPDRNGVQWMKRFDNSRFAFDPLSLGYLFSPFERFMA